MPLLSDAFEGISQINLNPDGNSPSSSNKLTELLTKSTKDHYYWTIRKQFYQAVQTNHMDGKMLEKLLQTLDKIALEFDSNFEKTEDTSSELNKLTACLALLKIFQNTGDLKPGKKEKARITAKFGTGINNMLLDRAAKCVDDLRTLISSALFFNIIAKIPKESRNENHRDSMKKRMNNDDNNNANLDLFGELFPCIVGKSRKCFHVENYSKEVQWLDRQQENEPVSISNGVDFEKTAQLVCRSGMDVDRKLPLTLTTLVNELSTIYLEATNDVCLRLFALLDSSKSSDEIQDELIQLLGFDKFDLLLTLLEHRNELVAEFQNEQRHRSSVIRNFDSLNQLSSIKPSKSAKYGQQIVVQSSLEVDLQKDLRKETKRRQKELNRVAKLVGTNELAEEVVGVEQVRRKELQLEQAARRPLAIEQERRERRQRCMQTKSRTFPNVYDAMASTVGNIDFNINGSKFILPESTEKSEKRTYDQVHVPAVDVKLRPDIGPLKSVSDLAPSIRASFSGTTHLNVIQSAVYSTVYETMENLLICAPTGAGKTNIALLAVLKTISEYTDESGRIDKDKFKIVYLAPMKALAMEMTRNFSKKLTSLGIQVRELTGDTNLSKREILDTQMLLVTPEKWDVVTRKSTGDISLAHLVRLLIIDEIHLLHDDRGPVIETLVARTLRLVEMRQSAIRIVGLSATLPNYVDVARFLHVNPEKGLFFFDSRFRPVPLTQTFVGVKDGGTQREVLKRMDDICYEKVVKFVREGHQVLVFVHARNATAKLALFLHESAANSGESELFIPDTKTRLYGTAQQAVSKSRNAQVKQLFDCGFGMHHAGMLRPDRILTERLFSESYIKVLCCTATLAWGVNLPAHAVIIRGTELYDPEQSCFVDLGILDVQQIFGRAGRPQFDKTGHGVIITQQRKLFRYLAMLTRQAPIESQFIKKIVDNLNAEIVLGTVANVEEAVEWLSYTYFFVRAQLNPLAYGIPYKTRQEDPMLVAYRHELVAHTASRLDRLQMIRYDHRNGLFQSTDLGRIASHYYVNNGTVELIVAGDGNAKLTHYMTDDAALNAIAQAKEFEQLKVQRGGKRYFEKRTF